jgi:signal transduction histidine kinase
VTGAGWSAATTVPSAPPAPSASALRAAFALYFADEALSSVRHDILNRLTAIGAIAYELRNLGAQDEATVEETTEDTTEDTAEDPAEDPARESAGEAAQSTAEARRERIADLNRQIGLMSQTVSRRLGPARDASARTSLTLAIDAAIAASLHPRAVRRGPSVEVAVRGSTIEVAVMVLALLDNAFEAQAESGSGAAREAAPVDLRCWLEDSEARIEVGDRGPGLEGEASERAFERFFTTKPGHAGLGLGMTRALATRLGGDLQLQGRSGADRDGTGACATLSLPLADDEGG